MPAAIVDPSVQAQGSIPASPIAQMLSRVVGVYGQQFPTPLERSEMQYRGAETQRLNNENAAPQQLQDLFAKAYAPQPPSAATDGSQPQAGIATAAAPSQTRDQMVSAALPELAGTLARAGQYGNIGSMFRTMTANAPGITAVSSDPRHPSPVSMSMLGAGDAYTSTPDASQVGFTPGQRDRNSKIMSILANNPGMNQERAANIVDGVFEYPQDPTTKNIFEINKATGEQHVLRQGNTQVTPEGNVTGGESAAPAAPSQGHNANNPFNLRPVGASTGFQSFKSPQEGLMAGLQDLAAKLSGQSKAMNGQQPTLRSIISTYSPSNENNTQQLIANASKRMNVDPDAPLSIAHLIPLSQAILAQEGNSGTTKAAPAVAPAQPTSQPIELGLKRGDLGIPFDSIYGGGAAVGKATGAAGALLGNSEANAGTVEGLRKLNSIKNQLIAINGQKPGQRNNALTQNNYSKQFPETDPQIHDMDNGVAGAVTAPGTAEDTFLANLEEAARNRVEDAKVLQDPNASAEERQSAKIRTDYTDRLFAGLPQPVQQAYQKSVLGTSAAVQPSNLQRGQQVLSGKVRIASPDGKQTGYIDQAELADALKNGWTRAK